MIRIAFVTDYDSRDVTKFSGTGYFMAKALESDSTRVERIGPLRERHSNFLKLKQLAYSGLLGKRHLRDREPMVLKSYARQLELILRNSKCDLVFCPGTVPISYLECSQPIAFWVDATFAGMLDYYLDFSNLTAISVYNGHRMEQSALKRARLALYCSDWAAKTALSNYEVNTEKVNVIPWGANLLTPYVREDVAKYVKKRRSNTCKLLFVGVEWERKGGDIALAVTRELNKQGLQTTLSVVGCKPRLGTPYPSFLEVLPFVSKKTEEGLSKFVALLAQSHFLMLPARAEAFGFVCCEASAFGVPNIVARTGGIPVVDYVNGRVMAQNATIADYCEVIWRYFENLDEYEDLALSSFDYYTSTLNWVSAGEAARSLIRDIL